MQVDRIKERAREPEGGFTETSKRENELVYVVVDGSHAGMLATVGCVFGLFERSLLAQLSLTKPSGDFSLRLFKVQCEK